MSETKDPEDVSRAARDAPGLGRAVVIGSVIGAVTCVAGVGLGMLIWGQVWQSSVGLALFVAFWGGIGFGSMMGGVLWATHAEADERSTWSLDQDEGDRAPGGSGDEVGAEPISGRS